MQLIPICLYYYRLLSIQWIGYYSLDWFNGRGCLREMITDLSKRITHPYQLALLIKFHYIQSNVNDLNKIFDTLNVEGLEQQVEQKPIKLEQ